MTMSRSVAISALLSRTKPLVTALSVAMLMCSSVYAATLGHSRIVSGPGQPLRIDVPVNQLGTDDYQSLRVNPAPAAAWAQAGLTPPVDLSSLRVRLVNGPSPQSRIAQISSSQPFDQAVADLLLEVHTSSGQQQYQVSILAPVRRDMNTAQGRSAGAGVHQGARRISRQSIHVRRGDTLFAIARHHAVPGVTVYQMMVALQRANPQAFIHGNMNLVKAGATLGVPDARALTAVSDREARRIFQEQALDFASYRQGLAAGKAPAVQPRAANKGTVSQASETVPPANKAAPRDQLKLSSGGSSAADAKADNRLAASKGIAESQSRVSQLEENVKHLNQALQGQGEAAKDAVVDGAKGLGQTIAGAAGAIAGAGDSAGRGADGSSNGAQAPAGQEGSAKSAADSAQSPGSPSAAVQAEASGAASHSSPAAPGGQSPSSSDKASDTHAGQAAAAGADAGNRGLSGNSTNKPGLAGEAGNTADHAANPAKQASNKAEQSVSWFQEHLLGVITALLAFVVLIIAWLLRRANVARDDDSDDHPSAITEAMVKEKLDKINLDLSQPPSDEPNKS
ncbi:type IV pilus assembly protein FimV [Paralcaligenes ginsengisoli]